MTQWSVAVCKTGDEHRQLVHHAHEPLEFSDVGGGWEFLDSLHLVRVRVDALGIDGVAQELDGCLGEFTLLIECDACFRQALEHCTMLVMHSLVRCMDEDVVHVADHPVKALQDL